MNKEKLHGKNHFTFTLRLHNIMQTSKFHIFKHFIFFEFIFDIHHHTWGLSTICHLSNIGIPIYILYKFYKILKLFWKLSINIPSHIREDSEILDFFCLFCIYGINKNTWKMVMFIVQTSIMTKSLLVSMPCHFLFCRSISHTFFSDYLWISMCPCKFSDNN